MTDPLLQRIDNLLDFISYVVGNKNDYDEQKDEEELYDNIEDKQSRQQLLDNFNPNSKLWTNKFAETVKLAQQHKELNLRSTFHGLRLLIQKQTLCAIENNLYQTVDGKNIIIDQNEMVKCAQQTKFYRSKDIINIANKNENNDDLKQEEQKKNDTSNIIKASLQTSLIICVGLPGSGKITFSKHLCDYRTEWNRSGIDLLGNKENLFEFIPKILKQDKKVIVEDCNVSKKERCKLLNCASNANNAICVWFDIKKEECQKRSCSPNIESLWKQFQIPSIKEGFAEIVIVKNDIDINNLLKKLGIIKPIKLEDNPQCDIDIDVLNIDCLDAAYNMLCNNYNPCLLNMANQRTPGGGWKCGSGAQEENISRRSTLLTSICNYSTNLINYPKNKQCILDKQRTWNYPIEDYGGIYSPNIIIFRKNETSGYEFLEKPYKISIITAAMFKEKTKKPNYDKTLQYKNNYKPQIVEKLKSVLRIAYDNGHDSIILSAWGCGAFKNPPLGQSKLWKYVLFNDKEFRGKFKKIIFAIFDDHNTGDIHNPFGNILPFIDVFDITQRRIKEFLLQIHCDKKFSSKRPKIGNKKKVNRGMDVFKELCDIFKAISDNEQSRDLDYNVVHSKFVNIPCAMQILYCGGFKRSSDGSRLQLEQKRIKIAQNVYQQLLKQQVV